MTPVQLRLLILAVVVGLGIIVAGPLVLYTQPYAMRLVTNFALLLALAIAWNIIGGFAGYPSFATGAFFGLGAYSTAIVAINGWHWSLGLLAGGLACAALALPFGFGVLRLRGHYFAVASLLLGGILKEITTGWVSLTGGGVGLTLPGSAGDPDLLAIFTMRLGVAVALIALIISAMIRYSRLGFGLDCIRMNETAAAGVGINAAFLKTTVFTISAAIIGVVGGGYALWIGYIDPSDVYDISWSVKPIVVVLLGGVGTIFGPVVGAVLFVVLEEFVWQNFLSFSSGSLGILIVVLLLMLPTGILPSFSALRRRS